MKISLGINELIYNPTFASKKIVGIIVTINNSYQKKLDQNLLSKIIFLTQLKLYQKQNYLHFYNFLNDYQVLPLNISSLQSQISLHLNEFTAIQKKIIFNNFALADLALNKKSSINFDILTIEEEKIIYFQKLAKKQISYSRFINKFGHLALNPYELAEKRFSEYKPTALLKIAKLTQNIKIKPKKSLKQYLNSKSINQFVALVGIRELAKFNALKNIQQIRNLLLKLARQKKINNIFKYSFNQILNF